MRFNGYRHAAAGLALTLLGAIAVQGWWSAELAQAQQKVPPKQDGPAQQSKVHIVEITPQMEFKQKEVRIKKGDTVKWVNNHDETHTATETSPKAGSLDTKEIEAGSFKEVVVDRDPGVTIDYRCEIHTFMTGKIIIEP